MHGITVSSDQDFDHVAMLEGLDEGIGNAITSFTFEEGVSVNSVMTLIDTVVAVVEFGKNGA